MSNKQNKGSSGVTLEKKGYQPNKGGVTGGHKPEKSELAPKNPPKKK